MLLTFLSQHGVQVRRVGAVFGSHLQPGYSAQAGVFGLIDGVAVARGTSALPPVKQIVARLDLHARAPGNDSLDQTRVFEEAPLGEGQQTARRDPIRQSAQQVEAAIRAGDVVQHAEQRDQIELAERLVGRLFEDVAEFEMDIKPGQRLARPVKQRGAAVESNIAQLRFADFVSQKDAKAPVATAHIQHGKRRVQVGKQPLPAVPCRLPSCVEVGGDLFVKAPVEVVQGADRRVVHNIPYNVRNCISHCRGLYMRTILKRIDTGSAFRVGFVLYALMFAIFGLLFVALQGLLISGLAGLASDSSNSSSLGVFFGAGVLGLLCFYGVGIIAAAVGGGIQFALVAFFYNLTANWIGGLKIELETESNEVPFDDIERDIGKPKRTDL